MSDDKERIRTLNDQLRKNPLAGKTVMTPGIAALGTEVVERLFATLSTFNDFCRANDPHEEHDFGAFDFDNVAVVFKIDYYDKTLRWASPNPADPGVTERVITVMLADEY